MTPANDPMARFRQPQAGNVAGNNPGFVRPGDPDAIMNMNNGGMVPQTDMYLDG